MNRQETRQLGIEFERRVQQLLPQKEFLDKMDTETIYSFLNQYQDKLIHDAFQRLDKFAEPQQKSSRNETLLKELISTSQLSKTHETKNVIRYELPNDFALYIKSISFVNTYYRMKKDNYATEEIKPVANELISSTESSEYVIAPNDTMKIIRKPIVSIEAGTIRVVHDNFTNIHKLELTYYRTPKYFSPLNNTNCELSIDLFDDLVSGAVALYVQYVAGLQKEQDKEKTED